MDGLCQGSGDPRTPMITRITTSPSAPGRNRTCGSWFRKPLRNLRRRERLARSLESVTSRPCHRAVHSRGEALADPQGSLNSVPLGPREPHESPADGHILPPGGQPVGRALSSPLSGGTAAPRGASSSTVATATRRTDPTRRGFAGTVYLVQVCKEHDPDPRRSMNR